ncbi:vWA domain-containing protein [methane-oxidizing endosymbiont of Gigantopelta aegis]|uniref:vWA domain-containing protein n=1 Tax=methane-oxidizing endosymbiont of Gigantopelta aegis TaxID=2794938 RepID=UPI0018DEA7DD|nr:VWA domain-containing protein [methane-oxidizing endosymbiont of Gigantopelta aegis]
MIHFAWPWFLLALPLPLLVRYGLSEVSSESGAALKVPFLQDFNVLQADARIQVRAGLFWLAFLAWCLLVAAATRPQWLGEPIEQAVSGRDLMLAVDVSGSMDVQDFVIDDYRVDRLTAVKKVASEFIARRVGDRIGLILFGTTPYLQAPLTFDRQTVIRLLNEAFIGITDDDPATSIGDAIGLAVKKLKNHPADSRVLILLTDGANTAGAVDPLQAAELAAQFKLKIYTIGIGADEMIVRDFFGARRVNPSRDLDEKTLKAIAAKTGGRYFRARDSQEMAQIYHILDQLEPVETDQVYFRPRSELFYWPLSLALLFATIVVVARART